MHIFVLTTTYELRVSRKRHLRDHPTFVPTALDSLMLAHKHLGSVNLRGGIHASGTKIGDLMIAPNRVGLGIIGIQETFTRGVEKRVYEDWKGATWTLHTGGISTGSRLHGTGFLVGPDFEVVSFTALSPRISWIKVQHHPTNFRGTKVGSGVGCFVNGYSPTESSSKTDPEGLQSFYSTAILPPPWETLVDPVKVNVSLL
jgi:hypothetical protein